MNLSRRGFLKLTGVVLAAPAIVRAESLMKIWTPPKDIILPEQFLNIGLDNLVAGQLYTFSTYIKSADGGSWNRVVKTFTANGGVETIKLPLETEVPLLWGTQLEFNSVQRPGLEIKQEMIFDKGPAFDKLPVRNIISHHAFNSSSYDGNKFL